MRSIITRALGVVVAAIALLLLTVSGAVADVGPAYPPSPPGITLSQSSVTPGSSFSISFTGFDPGSDVSVLVEASGVLFDGTVTADQDGGGSVTVDVPEDTPASIGTVTVTGVRAGEPLVLSAEFEVIEVLDDAVDQGGDEDDGDGDAGGATEDSQGADADGGDDVTVVAGDGLAETGSSVLPLLVLGGGVLLVGVGLLLAGRRRASALESDVLR